MGDPVAARWFPEFDAMARAGVFVEQADYTGVNAEIYDDLRGDTGEEVRFYASLVAAGGRVAELGCGTGSLTLQLAGLASEYWAVDVSPDMLARLEQKLRGTAPAPPVRIVAGDMAEAPLEGPFDLIFVPYNGLVHVIEDERLQALFRRSCEALGPRGKLVVDAWIPARVSKGTRKRCGVVSGRSGAWLIYSEEAFPSRDRRLVNMATVPLGAARAPVLTRVVERVFRRSELDRFFRLAGMRVTHLAAEHPLIGGEKRRYVGIGERRFG